LAWFFLPFAAAAEEAPPLRVLILLGSDYTLPASVVETNAIAPRWRRVPGVASSSILRRWILSLVNNHPARMCVNKPFEIGRQQDKVGRAFEVEAGPVRESVTDQRALAALARTTRSTAGKERSRDRSRSVCLRGMYLMPCITELKVQICKLWFRGPG
jgi:hypothetical protein